MVLNLNPFFVFADGPTTLCRNSQVHLAAAFPTGLVVLWSTNGGYAAALAVEQVLRGASLVYSSLKFASALQQVGAATGTAAAAATAATAATAAAATTALAQQPQ